MNVLFCQRIECLRRAAVECPLPPITEPIGANVLWIVPQGFSKERAARASKFHRHTFFEVHFGLRGCTVYEDENGELYAVQEGEYLCLPPNASHRVKETDPDAYRLSLAISVCDKQDGRLLYGRGEWVEAFLTLVLTAMEKNDTTTPQLLSLAVSTMMLMLSFGGEPTSPAQTDTRRDVRLLRALCYIRDNASQDIGVLDVAEAAHMSPRQLERLFEKSEGKTVTQAIARERTEQAKRLLETEVGMSIAQVAELLHFSNEYNFIRFFKRIEGVTPGKYHARMQKIP